jgi:glucosylglycerate phosphorylase
MTEMLYGKRAADVDERIERLIEQWRPRIPTPGRRAQFTERDAVLIAYGDMVRARSEPGIPPLAPLAALARLCETRLAGVFSFVHVLPFYPSSSDEGFSVIDYRAVDPALGTWDDLAHLRRRFGLMVDAVFNHVSVRSPWFQGFVGGDPRVRDFFITVPRGTDLSAVTRPRTLPLLTRIETAEGPRDVWTTFSADQVDLNFADPEVLLETIDTLLFYASRGAGIIRLDAIAYLWKRVGTSCIHLPETHRVIQIYRDVLDRAAPHVALVTETNVAHTENISYFGDGANEAQMVYNFALPTLVLNAFATGSAAALARWAAGLPRPSPTATFFNFLASHDGIGLNAAREVLGDTAVEALVQRTLRHGGLVSYRANSDGSSSAYELNINYFDALTDPAVAEPVETGVARMGTAHAIALALPGVPGIYFHSLAGSTGWKQGPAATGSNRSINRERLDLATLERELADPGSRRARVFARLTALLATRAAHPAFAPTAAMQVVDAGDAIFAVRRTEGDDSVLCLHNLSSHGVTADADAGRNPRDAVTGRTVAALRLDPYETLWVSR